MKFKYLLAASVVSTASAMVAVPAAAQSTGSLNFDDDVNVIELPPHGHAAHRCFRNGTKDISLRGFSLGQSVAYILE